GVARGAAPRVGRCVGVARRIAAPRALGRRDRGGITVGRWSCERRRGPLSVDPAGKRFLYCAAFERGQRPQRHSNGGVVMRRRVPLAVPLTLLAATSLLVAGCGGKSSQAKDAWKDAIALPADTMN